MDVMILKKFDPFHRFPQLVHFYNVTLKIQQNPISDNESQKGTPRAPRAVQTNPERKERDQKIIYFEKFHRKSFYFIAGKK